MTTERENTMDEPSSGDAITVCAYDTDGDGDCQYCFRRGGCHAIGGPFDGKPMTERTENTMRLGPLYIAPLRKWIRPATWDERFYRFENLPHIKPGRWGWGLYGLIEFGNRNPNGRFGKWLKRVGLWKW